MTRSRWRKAGRLGRTPTRVACLFLLAALAGSGVGDAEGTALDALPARGPANADLVTSAFGGADLAVPFHTIDSGGGHAAGGAFRLLGSIGQPDAAVVQGPPGGFLIAGGFQPHEVLYPSILFRDDFETGGSERWSGVAPPMP